MSLYKGSLVIPRAWLQPLFTWLYLKDFRVGHSKILYLYLGNPIPTEVKRSMSILGAPLLWGGFGKGPSWVGLGFQLLVYVAEVVKFCAFVWHYL